MEIHTKARTKIILSMIIWGTIGIFVRGVDLNSIEIAFFRALLGSCFLVTISMIKGYKIDIKILKENLLILILAGLALGINWITLFQAMKYTTISNAVLSYYFAPIFIVIFSSIIFKEEVKKRDILCLLGAILGLFLIIKWGNTEAVSGFNHSKGVSYGLIGAILYAIVVLLNKNIKKLSGFQSTLIQLFVASVTLSPIVFGENQINLKSIDMNTWGLILILGIVHTGIAYLMYFTSIRDVRSQSIAILSYIDPIVAIFVSFIFLNETMTFVQILGALMILSTSYISERNV